MLNLWLLLFIHFLLQFYGGEITCDINIFVFIFYYAVYIFYCCPQGGLCLSEQFHCFNIRQSHFGSVWLFVHFWTTLKGMRHDSVDLWFQPHSLGDKCSVVWNSSVCSWDVMTSSVNRQAVAIPDKYENYPHIVWDFFSRGHWTFDASQSEAIHAHEACRKLILVDASSFELLKALQQKKKEWLQWNINGKMLVQKHVHTC